MNAIEFLTQQHLELESLLDQLETASRRAGRTRLRLCRKIGDLVATHVKIEETILHRATKRGRTARLLDDGREAHLAIGRIAAGLAALDGVDGRVDAMVADLRERKIPHAREEERELFPVARDLLAPAWLDELAVRMEKMANELMGEAAHARLVRTASGTSRALRRFAAT